MPSKCLLWELACVIFGAHVTGEQSHDLPQAACDHLEERQSRLRVKAQFSEGVPSGEDKDELERNLVRTWREETFKHWICALDL